MPWSSGLVRVVRPDAVVRLDRARRVGPAQQARTRVDQVDPRAVGLEQAGRLVDGALEDVGQVRGRRDPGIDLAQRPLDLGALGELDPRLVEVGDEPRVRGRGGGVFGERADERDLRVVEGAGPGRERPERAEHLAAADHRGDDHRADADVVDDAVGVGRVMEGRVVA